MIAAVRKRPAGRPCKLLDADTETRILDFIRRGNYVKTSCLAAGISKQTFYNWLQRAEHGTRGNGDDIYIDFFDRLEKAREANVAERVAKIQEAGEKPQNWPANAWLLERMIPGDYGRRMELEVGPSKVLIALREEGRKLLQSDMKLIE